MNILITGGAGFIGTNLSKKLLEMGHNVYIFDDLSTGRYKNIQFLKMLKTLGQLFFYQCDITNLTYLQAIRDNITKKIDQVFHLASPASPKTYTKLWRETIKANTVGTFNLLEIAREHDSKFLFAGSSERYGQPLETPQKETYYGNVNSFGNRSCYDESKRLGETICFQYMKEYNLNTRIALIHNTFGPHFDVNDGRVIVTFIKQALQGEDITIFGSGEQYRCYTYVDDMVEGLIKLINSEIKTPINLGSNQKFTILETAQIIKDFTQSSSKIIYQKIDKDDPIERYPDLTRAKTELNWEPKISFFQGLEKTVNYVKEELEK